MNRRRSNRLAEQSQDQAGSSSSGEPVFLVVGRLRRPHGVSGEIILEVMTDFPQRLRVGKVVYVGDQHQPYKIASRRKMNVYLLLSFDGLETVEAVGELRNQLVYVRTEDLPTLPEGEYYHHQLIGLTAVNEQGQVMGRLEEILETGANDVYLIRLADGKELLVPAIEETIGPVDLEAKTIQIRQQEWE